MTIAGLKVRRRIFVSAGLVAVATGLWLYWTRSRLQPPSPPAPRPEAFVRLAGNGGEKDDRLMEEKAEYFDPTPLFIPTARNYSQGPLPVRLVRQPGQVFNDIPPKSAFNENSLASFAVNVQTAAASVPEVLAMGNEAPFAGFGLVDAVLKPLPERGGFIEVKALNTGDLVISSRIGNAELDVRDLAPVEYLVVVGRAGLVGEPVPAAGPGADEADGKVRNFLVKTFRLGDRLAPGQYVVSVGP